MSHSLQTAFSLPATGENIPNPPSIPGVSAALLSCQQPEDLDTVVRPHGLVKAQAAVSAGDRLLVGLAGMILSHLVRVFMLADESSLWVI